MAELLQPINSVMFLFPLPDVFVFTLKSNKPSQRYEVSLLAHRKAKVHTDFNWKQLSHYTIATSPRHIYLLMPVHVHIFI